MTKRSLGSKVAGRALALWLLGCLAVQGSSCWAGAPANDDCANATTLALGENPFTTVGATSAGPGVCETIGNDVWFKFNSTFTGSLQVSTCGDATFDTVIAAYSGCSCGSFTLLGCNDDGAGCPNHTSKLTVPVTAGNCYRIRVAGFNGATGTGVLTLSVSDSQNAASADVIKTGADPGDQFGLSVAGDAHFNGDSFSDVLVGAPRNDTLGVDTGRAYALQGDDLSALYTKTGTAAGDNFGFSVATCDANNDGREDLIIGAPLNDGNGASAGHVYVYSGFDGSLLWERDGFAAGDHFGYSVAWAGDVNNDGFDDVIVGAPYNDANGVNAGRAYVLDGQDGSVLRTVTGQTAGELFGWAVAGIGDINNDGKDDFAVGAPRHAHNGTDTGRVSIFSGTNGSVLKRLNGDAPGDRFGSSIAGLRFNSSLIYDMIAIGSPNNDAAGTNAGRVKVFLRNISSPACSALVCTQYTINGGNPGDRFGASVAIGKVTGTSFADIIVGAPQADLNGSNSGAVYVFNGATGALAHRFFGEAAGDAFGQSIAAAGDVNDDGNDDLIVGAPFNDAGGSSAGRAYMFFLSDSPSPLAPMMVSGGSIDNPGDAEPSTDDDQNNDANNDGAINGDDITAILSAWGPCANDGADNCPADLNGDGTVDVNDLLQFISAWHGSGG